MADAVAILESGLRAADPTVLVPRFVGRRRVMAGDSEITLDRYSSIHTVAFGKAADSMSRAVSHILPVRSGIVVVPHGSGSAIRGKRFRVHYSGHPKPDRRSVAAAKDVVKFLKNRRPADFVLFLVSGGASSLVALPDGVTLQDKIRTTDLLLRCGAPISDVNCVRKHISGIKGGRLVRGMPCDGASLIMSDVEGDDPGTISSGITHMDSTSFGQALLVIERHGLAGSVPSGVMERLRLGASGHIPETPKTPVIPHGIMANNRTCLDAMVARAGSLGYDTNVAQHFGNIRDAVDSIVDRAPKGRGCLVFGGEPTVKVSGAGRGGRNQELVLRVLGKGLRPGCVVASMGTDGIDGNTDAAGAMHRSPVGDAVHAGECLADNDSYSYFERHGGLIHTGHTGTNLLDIGLVLAER